MGPDINRWRWGEEESDLMNHQQLNRVIAEVKKSCEQAGLRLTTKRQRVLEVLLRSGKPLSAYEIVASYDETFNEPIPPMSVYRILDFLASRKFLHKLSSANKYVACAHIVEGCTDEINQFLICGACEAATEISIKASIMQELQKLVKKAGYTLAQSQLELQCLCNRCLANKA